MLKSRAGQLAIAVAALFFAFSGCGGSIGESEETLIPNETVAWDLSPEPEEEATNTNQVDTPEPEEYDEWGFDDFCLELIESHVLDELIPSGFDPWYAKSGDLNADGVIDVALVVSSESTLTRPLLLIVGDDAGGFALAKRNDLIIADMNSGGIHGDPFESLSIGDGELRICFFGGSSWRWEDNIVFRYSDIERDWLLQKEYHFSYHFFPQIMTGSYLDETLFDSILFEDYNSDEPDIVTVESVLLGETPNPDYEYYLVSLADKAIEKTINDQIEKYLDQFLAGVKSSGGTEEGHANLNMISSNVLSFVFYSSWSDNFYFSLNFDLKTGTLLRFADMQNIESVVRERENIISDAYFVGNPAPQLRDMLASSDNPENIGKPGQVFSTFIDDSYFGILYPTGNGRNLRTLIDNFYVREFDLRDKGTGAEEIVETFRSYSNNEVFYEYLLLDIPNKEIQNKINKQLQQMADEDLDYLRKKDQLDYSYYANVDYVNPNTVSLLFGNGIVSFDLRTGNRIRLRDIVDIDGLSALFWQIAQSIGEKEYYANIEDMKLPEYSVEQLKKIFTDSDGVDKNTAPISYFYCDGIGIDIDREFSAFISFEDLRPVLKKDYWSEFVNEGFVPTVYERG